MISQSQQLFLTRLAIGLAQGLILYLGYRLRTKSGPPPKAQSSFPFCWSACRPLSGSAFRRAPCRVFAAGSRTVSVFHGAGDGWSLAATFDAPCPGMLDALRSQKFEVMPPATRWNDLMVAGRRLRLNPGVQDDANACAKAGAN